MLFDSWVCGPAAGPTGLARRSPKELVIHRPVAGRQNWSVFTPKIDPSRSSSVRAHVMRWSNDNGRIRSPMAAHAFRLVG